MRTFLISLVLLVGVSLGLTWWNGTPQTWGMKLVEALDQRPGAEKLRGAIQVLDYQPDAATIARLRDAAVAHGQAPGMELGDVPGRRWIENVAAPGAAWDARVRFNWQSGTATPYPLRSVHHPNNAADNDAPQMILRQALSKLNVSEAASDELLHAASALLAPLSDADLFNEWLRADRATLLLETNPASAVRRALLLLARPERSAVLAFQVTGMHAGNLSVYAIPLESTGGAAWLELVAFTSKPEGNLAWSGVLHVQAKDNSMPDPAGVRAWAMRMAEEASARRSPPPPDTHPSAILPRSFNLPQQ